MPRAIQSLGHFFRGVLPRIIISPSAQPQQTTTLHRATDDANWETKDQEDEALLEPELGRGSATKHVTACWASPAKTPADSLVDV